METEDYTSSSSVFCEKDDLSMRVLGRGGGGSGFATLNSGCLRAASDASHGHGLGQVPTHMGFEGRIKRCGVKEDRWVSRVGARRVCPLKLNLTYCVSFLLLL